MPLEQQVILNLGNGTLEQGFPTVTAKCTTHNLQADTEQIIGALPPAPDLSPLYQQWQTLYRHLTQRQGLRSPDTPDTHTHIEGFDIHQSDLTHISDHQLNQLSQTLIHHLNQWLQSAPFRPIDQQLRSVLNRNASIQLTLELGQQQLLQLPWHRWSLVEDFPNLGLALSPSEYRQLPSQSARPTIRILGIIGDAQYINTTQEQKFLKSLPESETQFLIEPTRQTLNQALWDPQGWDILFFAGHSYTQNQQGYLQINRQPGHHHLSIPDLDYALQTAIQKGLQLAIFNSCDGLGLAQALGHLHIPHIIAMREPVPNQVAQDFFHFLLTALIHHHHPLHLATRAAQRQLQGLEHDFPGASWLPVLFQNPSIAPLTWQQLNPTTLPQSPPPPTKPPPTVQITQLSLVSIGITLLILLIRALGFLEPLELKTYDTLLQLRPSEGPDPRLLLIQITEQDIANQPAADRGGASLSDRALDQILAKLEQSDATAIGLDIYRDNPVRPEFPALAKRMKAGPALFGICHVGSPGVPAAPELRQQPRQGFNNVLLDHDHILRRQLLAVESPQPCDTHYAFALQLATHHLSTLRSTTLQPQNPKTQNIRIGQTDFPSLATGTGGYHNLDDRGHQILINYRATSTIAETVSLNDFLNQYDPAQVKHRIVLIGTVAPTFNDHRWNTPLGQLTGIEVQGHLISQILSTQSEQRALIWAFPHLMEAGFVGTIILLTVLLNHFLTSVKHKLYFWALMILFLCAIASMLLQVSGLWLPLVPSLLGIAAGHASTYTLKALKK